MTKAIFNNRCRGGRVKLVKLYSNHPNAAAFRLAEQKRKTNLTVVCGSLNVCRDAVMPGDSFQVCKC